MGRIRWVGGCDERRGLRIVGRLFRRQAQGLADALDEDGRRQVGEGLVEDLAVDARVELLLPLEALDEVRGLGADDGLEDGPKLGLAPVAGPVGEA